MTDARSDVREFSAVALGCAVAASGCWGAAVIAAKSALEAGLAPLPLATIQLLGSLALLTPAMLFLRIGPIDQRNRPTGVALPGVMISGAIEYALTAGLFAYGVAWTTAGNAALINATEPVIIALLAVVFLREPLSARLIGVIACVTAGLLLVMSNELRTTGSLRAGDLMVLAAALSGATYAILSRQLVSSIDPLPLAWAQQLWGLAALLLLAAIASAFDIELFSVTHASDRSRAIASALGSGILGHAAAVWLHLHALRRMPASAFAVFLGMVPVFTFAGAYVLLDEVVSMTQFIGGALVITAALGAAGVYRTSPIHKGATG